jgi:hypothetical protein
MSSVKPEYPLLPEWAPRLPQNKIHRFYENDAGGIYDEDLIEEVGYGLWRRCQSFVEANDAVRGRAHCPSCGTIVAHTSQKDETLHCSSCGWECSWNEYFHTIQHRQLSGAEPVIELFQSYIYQFPAATSLHEKVLCIDRLIHGFHWYLQTGKPTRPAAVNLIQGRLQEVIALLDELSLGENNTPGVRENRAEWEKNIENARSWHRKGGPDAPPG